MALHPYAKLKVDSEHFQLIEHFTIIVYDKTSDLQHVNEARQEMFCQKEKSMERLPPTQDTLMRHTNRAAYIRLEYGASVIRLSSMFLF